MLTRNSDGLVFMIIQVFGGLGTVMLDQVCFSMSQ